MRPVSAAGFFFTLQFVLSLYLQCSFVGQSEDCAIKYFRINRPSDLEAARRECEILAFLRKQPYNMYSQHVQTSYYSFLKDSPSSGETYVMTELQRFSLLVVLTAGAKFLEPTRVQNYARQLVKGMWWLHSLDIVHRDLKPDNILIQGNYVDGLRLLVADFGLSYWRQSPAGWEERWVGTTAYQAPELLQSIIDRDKDFSANVPGTGLPKCAQLRADYWAVGVVILE